MAQKVGKVIAISSITAALEGGEYTRNVDVFNDKSLQDWSMVGAVLRTLSCWHILTYSMVQSPS